MGPDALDASVTARVPVVVSRDDRYFVDRYQAMPRDGYAALFDRMIYCGPLDEYFGSSAGTLPYRSLRFEHQLVEAADGQPVGTVNYPNEFDFTRITDFRYLSGERAATTALLSEYPVAHQPGVTEPYYPVPSPDSRALANVYRQMAQALAGRVWFAGRLADFQYYNMDQAVGRALSLVDKELAPALERTAA